MTTGGRRGVKSLKAYIKKKQKNEEKKTSDVDLQASRNLEMQLLGGSKESLFSAALDSVRP